VETGRVTLLSPFDRLLVEDPARVVHGMREQEPFEAGFRGPAQHFGRHVDRVREPDIAHDSLAELARLHAVLGSHESRFPAKLEIDHQLDAPILRGIDDPPRLIDIGGERLLHENVLAGLDHREAGLRMRMVGGGDPDRLDVTGGDVTDLRRPVAADLVGERLRPVGVEVADELQIDDRMGG